MIYLYLECSMRYLLRKIARCLSPISTIIIRFWYHVIKDVLYNETQYCSICKLPMARGNSFSTYWADAEVLYLKKPYYVYTVCKHCRKTKPWDKILGAYYRYWESLDYFKDRITFDWDDIVEALDKDRRSNGVKGETKFWKNQLLRSYKKAQPGESIYCTMTKDKKIIDLIKAVEQLGMPEIYIQEIDNKIKIKFNKDVKTKEKGKKEIIYL